PTGLRRSRSAGRSSRRGRSGERSLRSRVGGPGSRSRRGGASRNGELLSASSNGFHQSAVHSVLDHLLDLGGRSPLEHQPRGVVPRVGLQRRRDLTGSRNRSRDSHSSSLLNRLSSRSRSSSKRVVNSHLVGSP